MAKTFTRMGDAYPLDSKYAREMAKYMAPPSFGGLSLTQWNQARDWAKKHLLTLDEMKSVLIGTDYIGTPRSVSGWDDLAQRLNIPLNRKPKRTPPKMPVSKYDDRPDLDYEGRIKGVFPSGYKGGKSSHDADFRAGFKAGKKAFQQWSGITSLDVEKAYRRVSSKHGNWWEAGYQAAIALGEGAYNTQNAQLATAMGLGPVAKKAPKKAPKKRPRANRFSVRCHSYQGGYLMFEGSLTRAEADKVYASCKREGYSPVIFDGRKKIK